MRMIYRHLPDGDLPLAVRTSGSLRSGVPVLLVHGMGDDHSTWRSLGSVLRHIGRPVISVDMRGHGRSGRASSYLLDDFAADLGFVLDEMAVDEADVVGHSLGAHTALRFAMAQPGRVRRLVLEEIPPMPRDQADLDEHIVVSATVAERARGVWKAARNPFPLIRFDAMVQRSVTEEFRQAQPQWWDDAASLDVASLIISGGDRSFLPVRHLRALGEVMPDAEFTTIAVGHSVHRDARIRFDATVSDFLFTGR